jgi:hypothetical protein
MFKKGGVMKDGLMKDGIMKGGVMKGGWGGPIPSPNPI